MFLERKLIKQQKSRKALHMGTLFLLHIFFFTPERCSNISATTYAMHVYKHWEYKNMGFLCDQIHHNGQGFKDLFSLLFNKCARMCDQGMSVCPEDILTATHRLWKKTLEERRNNIIEVLSIHFSGFCLVPEINVYCRVMLFSFTVGFRYVINFPVFLHFVCRWCQILAMKCTRLLRKSFSHKQRRWNVPLQSSRSQTEVLWSLGVRESLLSDSIK